ncbi:lipoate--protein ligase [Hydrogenobacter sp. T-2]|uniref:lipoyl protein ligase domain-containing protein n=1 Tax=Pampinifervens diazotrophicum TaxID=1632018 RepID=UPI002B25CA39|nr:lipoate--protein ligase [Hydrogenobacter sp. T-2]WPM33021.1 lipoate--protein ligase [Hydrogenobacter sp. T-2]
MEVAKSYDLSYVETLKGVENMQKDWENLLLVENTGKPVFRLYQWQEPTISIGYSQEEPNISLPVVKRPTGGGALLHGWDLSFSYAGLRKDWGWSFTKVYKNFMGLILESLRNLDPKFEMSRYRGGYEDYFCYFYPTLGEITYKGKKVLACAMRLLKSAFLIHGSLFIELDYEEFERLTGIHASIIRERVITFREINIPSHTLVSLMRERGIKLSLL